MEENRELSDPAALLIKVDGGNGSGFFVGKNLIATNIHVVARTTSVSAKLIGTQTEFVVEGIAAFDPKNDLVILKIVGEVTSLPLGDSDLIKSGDIVQAVGYPNRKYTVTEGPIRSIRDSDKWIRMGFKTLCGNSGGPILNRNGRIIGVVVADHDWCSFAIPINTVKKLLGQTSRVEPLSQWQERQKIRAYAYLVQGQTKHSTAQRKHSATLYEEAIVNFDKAIQLNPDYALCYYNRGTVKSQLGRLNADESDLTEVQQYYRDAIDDYTEAIKLCPDYASAYSNRATARSNLGQSKVEWGDIAAVQQDYRDAIDDYTEAIELCPDYALAYNNRADVKCHFGRSEDTAGNIKAAKDLYQEALIDINTAIELDSNDALFFHTRGEIRHALGDYSAAIEDYEKAREIDPDYTDVCKDLKLAKKALEQQKTL